MINLLSPKEKQVLLLEKKKRLATILWFLIFFFLVCLILVLFSLKIYLQNQVKFQKTLLLESEREYEQSGIQDLREKINSANLFLTKINSFYQKKIYFSKILEKISKTPPRGLYFTSLSIVFCPPEKETEKEKSTLKISLSGFSPTREILFDFKKKLEKEENFKEVDFPRVSWVKPTNIDFSITFEIEQVI